MSQTEVGLPDDASPSDYASLPDEASLPDVEAGLPDEAIILDETSLPDDKEVRIEFEKVMEAIFDLKWKSVPGRIARMKKHPIGGWPQDNASLEQQRDALHCIISQVETADGHEIKEILRLTTMKALVKAVPVGDLRTKLINMPGSDGITALQLAVRTANTGALSTIQYLIDHGANRYDDTLLTPIDKARDEGIQVPVDVMALIQGDHKQEHESGNVLKCKLYILQKYAEDKETSVEEEDTTWSTMWTYLPCKPVTEVLEGPLCLLEEFRRRHREIEVCVPASAKKANLPPTTLPKDGNKWLSCWLHLPERNLEHVKAAARQIFSSKSAARPDPRYNAPILNDILAFINHMGDQGLLDKPGNYFPGAYGFYQASNANVQCIVLPILAIDDHPLDRRQRAQDQQFSFGDVSLDEYCYECLDDKELRMRNGDQVFTRYSVNQKRLREEKIREEQQARFPDNADRRNKKGPFWASNKEPSKNSEPQQETPGDHVKMVVVSPFWIWILGDVVVTNYKRDSGKEFWDEIGARCRNISPIDPTTLTQAILRFLLDECVKNNEPFMPGANPIRILDGAGAFASQIAFESKTVTGFYNEFEKNLGKIDKTYFTNSIRVETETLRHLDDILDELAMLRRVQEDSRLVFVEFYDFEASAGDRLVERGRSKLNRLERDALRARESLVTLLSLQQREVNTEGLLNSEFQTQIVFIFTAATVFFAPLSWVTSLLALTIQGFSPADSVWSKRGVAIASSVTVASFALLILLGWSIWQYKAKLFSFCQPKQSGKSDDDGGSFTALTYNAVTARGLGRDWMYSIVRRRGREHYPSNIERGL